MWLAKAFNVIMQNFLHAAGVVTAIATSTEAVTGWSIEAITSGSSVEVTVCLEVVVCEATIIGLPGGCRTIVPRHDDCKLSFKG